MSWTYKTWSEEIWSSQTKDSAMGAYRMYQVRDKWIPPWHFNEEKKIWEPIPGQENPPTEN